MFFKTDVNNPAIRIIMPWPIENKNNINAAYAMFAVNDAVAMIPAKIGVEQGVVAKANTKPKINGYVIELCFSLLGNFLTRTGKFISIIPTRFKPKIKINDVKIKTKYVLFPAPKTWPVRAAITPTIVSVIAKPKIKNIIWMADFETFCSGVAPM